MIQLIEQVQRITNLEEQVQQLQEQLNELAALLAEQIKQNQ